jgi:hypothetical protein
MRSVLQFLGFASGAAWVLLAAGTILTASANADTGPDAPAGKLMCNRCYTCNSNGVGCYYSGTGRGCVNNTTCNCNLNNGNP